MIEIPEADPDEFTPKVQCRMGAVHDVVLKRTDDNSCICVARIKNAVPTGYFPH